MEVQYFVATVRSTSAAGSLCYYWRDRIVEKVIPTNFKVINMVVDVDADYKREVNGGIINFHGKMLIDLIESLPEESMCLILDVDAFPVSEEGVLRVFELAKLYGVAGNAQRTNCISNGEHLYVAPSFMCIDVGTVRNLGDRAWVTNSRSDTGEEIMWTLNVPEKEVLFYPYKTRFKPIWNLKSDYPELGIGTSFREAGGLEVSYHHFFSRVLVSRLHFFVVSFLYYVQIRGCKTQIKENTFSFRNLKHNLKLNLLYFLNKIN